MSEDQIGNAGPTERDAESVENASQVQGSDAPKDSVAYDTYKRVLSNLKKTESRFEQMQSEYDKMRESLLESEGKKDELIDTYRKKLEDTEKRYKSAVGTYAYKSVASTIEREAIKEGCVDTSALIQLSQLDELNVDDNFEVDQDQVKTLIDQMKKSKPYLFQKQGPKINSTMPGSESVRAEKNLSDLSVDELKQMYRKVSVD